MDFADDDIERVRGWVDDAARVVILTGAGISTDSGIPDFRGPQGLWTKNPAAEKTATLQHFLSSRDVRVQSWRNRLESDMWQRDPNIGHFALVDLERRGKLHGLVTQNVDGLHQKAGNSEALMIEVHGTIHRYKCLDCGDEGDIDTVLDRVRDGEDDPACTACGGIVKSATISFGQALVPEVIDRAMQVAAECDLLIAIGTSLAVYPAANVVPVAKRRGAKVVIINAEPTEMDDLADAVLRRGISEVLPRIVAASQSDT